MALPGQVRCGTGHDVARICILGPDPAYDRLAARDAANFQRLFEGDVEIRGWREAGDLADFALVMPLLAWGYHNDPERWFALLDACQAARVRLANGAGTLRWNSDKAYLVELAGRGVPVVPTLLSSALSQSDLEEARGAFGSDALIVKPPLSAGADRTYRLTAGAPLPEDIAGARMLIQPMMESISGEGEYSLFYFDGVFSHAIVKRPARGDFRVQEQFGGREEAVEPEPAATACAATAMAALEETPLYARVDLVRDVEGFALMEIELIEPSLFLHHARDGGAAFAAAVRKHSG